MNPTPEQERTAEEIYQAYLRGGAAAARPLLDREWRRGAGHYRAVHRLYCDKLFALAFKV